MRADSAELFRHVSAEKAAFYRCIMDVFAAAKRQYRLQLRPDEVLAEARWPDGRRASRMSTPRSPSCGLGQPRIAARHGARLEPQRLLPRALSLPALAGRRSGRIGAGAFSCRRCSGAPSCRRWRSKTSPAGCRRCTPLAGEPEPDAAKIHATLRDLVRVFEGLADNAQAFMAGVARSIELQQAEAGCGGELQAPADRLSRALHRRSGAPLRRYRPPHPCAGAAYRRDAAAGRRARGARCRTRRCPGPGRCARPRYRASLARALERPARLVPQHRPRAAAGRAAAGAGARRPSRNCWRAIAALNERRSGRSDRSADFRVLASWFAACADDGEAHRLARAAFALNPARHFSLNTDADAELPASTRWADAPPLQIHPRLREYGEAAPRGPLPRVRDRGDARALLALRARRGIAAGRGGAQAPRHRPARRAFRSSANSTCMPSACSWDCSAKR